jgi:hypothetical protein
MLFNSSDDLRNIMISFYEYLKEKEGAYLKMKAQLMNCYHLLYLRLLNHPQYSIAVHKLPTDYRRTSS